MFQITPNVKWLALLNVAVFFLMMLVDKTFGVSTTSIFGLHDLHSPLFRPWQLLTHVFMHGNFGHLFSNMFALIIYGPMIEQYLGGKKFIQYYFITALGAMALHSAISFSEVSSWEKTYDQFIEAPNHSTFLDFVQSHEELQDDVPFNVGGSPTDAVSFAFLWEKQQNNPRMHELAIEYANLRYQEKRDVSTVGASGAVFGLILAFGILFGETMLYLYFLFPIKAKYIVLVHGALELFEAARNSVGDNVAHFAHIGGMVFGYLLLMYWKKGRKNLI